MITDGGGFNTFLATSMYQGRVGRQVYDRPGWVCLGCTNYPLTTSKTPGRQGIQEDAIVFQPGRYWNTEPTTDQPYAFAGYLFACKGATDSAAAGTALAAGIKTYNRAINYDNFGRPLLGKTLPELAKMQGKSAGVITSVPWSHATPAALGGAHNLDRDNYEEIAIEMLAARHLDVIMGAGHPGFDDNGEPRTPKRADYRYVGGKPVWDWLVEGTHPLGWVLVETKEDFASLEKGPTPRKVLGTARVANTLQCSRRDPQASPAKGDGDKLYDVVPGADRAPFEVPLNRNVPSLPGMTRTALHCLESNRQGFYLMIESGAVDWAGHANNMTRMIEEQADFVAAIEAVVQWIERHGGWDENLLVITADHETGMLWGPESDREPFQPLEDRGPKQVPGHKYLSKKHSNGLVPLYARGAGSERLLKLVRGVDVAAAGRYRFSGKFVDNTDVFTTLAAAITPAE